VSGVSETGRAADFEDLFRRTRLHLLAYLTRRTRSPEDAADLLAETYLIAWRRFESIPAGEDARPWLFGVARNLLKKRASRSRGADALVERLALELRAADTSREAPTDGQADAVLRALARLGELDREILALTAWEGLTPTEVAAVIGTSPNRVRVRLHRARDKLARELRPAKPPSPHGRAIVAGPD
jgi:RNA polymerase sigma factor (sigma-70 family)